MYSRYMCNTHILHNVEYKKHHICITGVALIDHVTAKSYIHNT